MGRREERDERRGKLGEYIRRREWMKIESGKEGGEGRWRWR